ncbi:MAG: Hsp20/alpha crystallin family protein [bacterium]
MIWPLVTRYAFDTDPFQDLDRVRNTMDRWFTGYAPAHVQFPAVSLWVGTEEAVVLAQVPGVDSKDVSLTLTGDVLTIEGKRDAVTADPAALQRNERDDGAFSRSIRVPFDVDASQVKATGEHGVLRITLPRSEASKPRKIAVNG